MKISTLGHTWLIDIDGTIVEHNGYLTGEDKLLPGVKEFWKEIPEKDFIILLTARPQDYWKETLEFIKSQGLRFDHAIFNLPTGERILINDSKPSGLDTAIGINLERNIGLENLKINLDKDL